LVSSSQSSCFAARSSFEKKKNRHYKRKGTFGLYGCGCSKFIPRFADDLWVAAINVGGPSSHCSIIISRMPMFKGGWITLWIFFLRRCDKNFYRQSGREMAVNVLGLPDKFARGMFGFQSNRKETGGAWISFFPWSSGFFATIVSACLSL